MTWKVFALLFGLKTLQAMLMPSKDCWKPLTLRQPMSHLKSFGEVMRNSICPAHFSGLGMKIPLLNYIDGVKNFWWLLVVLTMVHKGCSFLSRNSHRKHVLATVQHFPPPIRLSLKLFNSQVIKAAESSPFQSWGTEAVGGQVICARSW